MFLFSFIRPERKLLNYLFLFIFCVIGLYSTLQEKNYYSTQHFADFKGIALKTIEWNEKYGEDNITRTLNITHPYYINYYFTKFNKQINFKQYKLNNDEDLLKLKCILDSAQTPFFLHGVQYADPPYTDDIIQNKYPFITEDIEYNTGGSLKLYGKSDSKTMVKSIKPVLTFFNDFENLNNLGYDPNCITYDTFKSGNKCIKMDSLHEWGPNFRKKISEINGSFDMIQASIWAYVPEDFKDIQLVLSITSKSKETILWTAAKFIYYINKNEWGKITMTLKLDKKLLPDDEIAIYVWNLDKKTLYIDDFGVNFIKSSI